MADDLNALLQANRSATVLQGIMNPAQVNPLAGMNSGVEAASKVIGLQQQQQTLSQNQQNQTLGKLNYTAGVLADLLNKDGQITGDDVHGAAMQHVGDGISSVDDMNKVLSTMPQNTPENPNAVRGWLRQIQIANLNNQQRIMAGFTPTQFDTGGQIVVQNVPTLPGAGPGSGGAPSIVLNKTLSPGEVTGFVETTATQADVDAGRASTIGQRIFIPNAEIYRQAGVPLPPGLGGGGGTGGGAGVVNSDGTTASTTNQPRLLKVPGQTTTTTPPAATTAAPLPIPPVPPAVVPPPTTATTAAPVATPPAPLPAAPGAVWNPNNPVGTSTVAPPAPPPPPGARAAIEGGVPVASTNALQTPSVGTPGPPSPLVPGDVNAIQAGMNQARATPTAGTQTAFNSVAVGPGTEEAQGQKTSADKLAADDLERTSFQQTQFPFVQALKLYGEGTKTGPGTDFWNQVAGSIRTPLAKIGINVGPLADTTERVDALGKWLASIQSGNPVSAKSDAELAQVLKGSASTHINEVAGEDMVKAGYGLLRMKAALNAEWHSNPQMQQQYGTYLNYLGDMNSKLDPRAFMVDTLNDAQKQRLQQQLKSGGEANAKRFNDSYALAVRNGLVGGAGSQAMP